jgi:parallel beta-helix repeat protein
MFSIATSRRKKFLFKLSIIVFIISMAIIFLFASQNINASTETPESPTQLYYSEFAVSPDSTTEEIQEVIDKASIKGGTISFDSGYYKISEPIILKSNITITGAGKNITVLKRKENTDFGYNGLFTTNSNENIYNVIIKNLTIDSESSKDPTLQTNEQTKATNYGLLIHDSTKAANKILLENFKIKNCSIGMYLNNTKNITIRNCEFSNNGGLFKYWHNVYLNKVSKVSMVNSYFNYSPSGNGLEIRDSDNLSLDDCHIYNNYFKGINITKSSNIEIFSCNIYNNTTSDGIKLGDNFSGVNNFILKANYFSSNGGYGINITDKNHNGKLKNNLYDGNNIYGALNVDSKDIAISDYY